MSERWSAERRALMAKRLRAAGEAARLATREPIAIVGMACRFPGGVDSPQAYWDLLARGSDAMVEVPPERWDNDALVSAGRVATRWGGFLAGIDGFDHGFFGISPREAERMDPQQRLLLEVAYEALEDGGKPVERLARSRAGVFVGAYYNDYLWLQLADPAGVDAYTSSGTANSMTANRLSYLLDLRGPSLTVDTACSSSLVAAHLACQSLRLCECDLAVAGGVSLMLSAELAVSLSSWGVLAPDGRCKTFDARADGFGRGEGCGMVVLKRLSDALADGDRVLAVIRGTAVNQDGRSNGLTAPSPAAQADVVRRALEDAGVAPSEIGYVETHGTGTALGDPIEVEALATALGRDGRAGAPCVLGAVKTNIGHLEAAAGVAGIIKVALALQHGEIPPNLHFSELNPHLAAQRDAFVLPTERWPWAPGAAPRVAGVSSFGFGGTNAHIVIEEAPAPRAADAAEDRGGPYVLPVSARSPAALRALAGAYRDRLAGTNGDRGLLGAICATAALRRSHHDHRLAIVADAPHEAAARLEAPIDGAAAADEPLAFVFSGQGGQAPGLGRELLAAEPAFREVVLACDELMRPLAGWSVVDELAAEPSRLGETEVAQPVVFAVQVGLAALFRSFGLEPAAVTGHSLGEVAAAHVAGALALEDAVRIVVERGRLMQREAGRGAMAAVTLAPEEAERELADADGRVVVAAVNARRSLVLSGDPGPLEDVLGRLSARGVQVRRMPGGYAFHSPQMESAAAALARAVAGLEPHAPRLPLFSTVTGGRVDAAALTAAHWADNVRQPVRFAAAVAGLEALGCRRFLELGPHPALGPAIADGGREAIASLRRGTGERDAVRQALARLYALGADVRWSALYAPPRPPLDLPAYPWQRQRHWIATAARPLAPAAVHELRWRPYAPSGRRRVAAADWLVLADRGGAARALQARVEARGGRCRLVGPECPPEELRRLTAGAETVVDLWSLDVGPADWERAGCGAALDVARAAAGGAVCLATRGTQAVVPGDAVPGLVQAPLWGLGRVLELERPDLTIRLVDLDPAESSRDADAERLVDALECGDGEAQIAWRAGRAYVPRLVPAQPPAASAPPPVRADGAYLVTGGTGALGLRLAGWLAERGAGSVLLAARRAPSAAAAARIAELRATGARIKVVAADVADRDAMAAALAAAPPLRGVIHAAGVTTRRAPAAELSGADLAAVLRPKVAGGRVLHELTLDAQLDFFVACSSIAAVLGTDGLGAYAAANHFLDALAHHRRARGLPALTVDWGLLAGGGMASDEDAATLGRMGMGPLAAEAAVDALEGLLARGVPQAIVAAADWSRLKPVFEARGRRHILDELGAAPAPAPSRPLVAFADVPERERGERVLAHIAARVASVLGVAPAELERRRGFFDMGMDSLMAVDLRRRLEADLGRPLASTVAFDHPTAERLAAHVASLLRAGEQEPAGEPANAIDALQEMSEELALERLGTRIAGEPR